MSDMTIRPTAPSELEEVLGIYARAREFMRAHGNPNQWINGYPTREAVAGDIADGSSYVCEDGEGLLAAFRLLPGPEPTYREIFEGAWPDELPYGVVHRIASAGRRPGAASFCLDRALAEYGVLRIDTHRDNLPMQSLLAKKGFTRCGIIYLANGDERLAYHKKASAV